MDLAAGRMSSGANKRIFDLNTTVGSIGGDMASSGGAGGGMDVDEVDEATAAALGGASKRRRTFESQSTISEAQVGEALQAIASAPPRQACVALDFLESLTTISSARIELCRCGILQVVLGRLHNDPHVTPELCRRLLLMIGVYAYAGDGLVPTECGAAALSSNPNWVAMAEGSPQAFLQSHAPLILRRVVSSAMARCDSEVRTRASRLLNVIEPDWWKRTV